MVLEPDIQPVLKEYSPDCQPQSARFLAAAGGFSGALLWKLETPRGTLALRRWPIEHPTPDRLAFIHAVLLHSAAQGFQLLACPLPSLNNATWLASAGHFWELSPWLPGHADYHAVPSPAKLAAALDALARFHLAAESFPARPHTLANSPGLQDRFHRLRRLHSGEFSNLLIPPSPAAWPALQQIAEQLLPLAQLAATRILPLVANALQRQIALQPCLRDIWHDHILFSGEHVTGIVDYGALRLETVAGDVARLLGSLALDDPMAQNAGLAAYTARRPLSADERYLIEAFDQSTVVYAGVQWLDWIYRQGREFADRAAVEQRCQHWLARLQHLVESPLPDPP